MFWSDTVKDKQLKTDRRNIKVPKLKSELMLILDLPIRALKSGFKRLTKQLFCMFWDQ